MSRIGIYLLLLAIWVQSATLLSQRAVVSDPVELAHFNVIADVEIEKPTGRVSVDCFADLSNFSLASPDLAWYALRSQPSFCQSHRAVAPFQRGPPPLV